MSRASWPYKVQLSIRIMVGDVLKVELTTVNIGDQEMRFTEGLHTYFQVSDIAKIKVFGLDGCEYVDLVCANNRRRQEGEVTFDGELGRIYLNTEATCIIEDVPLKRRIRIEKTGGLSTAVWNPWAARAAAMDDLGAKGWRNMVCVESANALENIVILKAGKSHTLAATYTSDVIST